MTVIGIVLIVAALEAERSTADTRHGPIEYVSWGEGPPVLVVHGAGGGFDQGRVSILAMSGGAPPSLQFAAMFPDRVDRMMLLSPAPFTPFSPEVEDRPIPTWAYSAIVGNDVIYWTLTKLARRQLEAAFDARAALPGSIMRARRSIRQPPTIWKPSAPAS
jgi:2-hydroxy-6-oxonona-2,4-dienedioate hydrolase